MLDGTKIILVFGLPGAGKTTLINGLTNLDSSYHRLSGGSLINAELPQEDRDKLRKLGENQILLNQEKLVLNFQIKLKQLKGKKIIFDGHCVVKDGNKIVEIPVTVIERLTPDLIVFVDVEPKTIAERRSEDANRPDRESESIEQLQKQRDLQISICKNYSELLNVPLKVQSIPNTEAMLDVLQDLD